MPPSRPMPDLPLPPNGAPRSRTKKQLTQTVPALSRARDPLGPLGVAGDQGRGQPEPGVVGHRDGLLLVGEGLDGQHRAEDLLGEDLAARLRRRPGSSGRSRDRPAPAFGPPPRIGRAPSAMARSTKPSTRSKCGRLIQRRDVGGLVARVALDDRARLREHPLGELVGDRLVDQDPEGAQADLAGVVELLDGQARRRGRGRRPRRPPAATCRRARRTAARCWAPPRRRSRRRSAPSR